MTHTTNTPAPSSVLIPAELASRIADALGRFVSDEGWGQADMDTSDELAAALAAPEAVPQEVPSDAEPLPTLDMVIAGAEAVSLFRDTDAYNQMSGCAQSQESARVCWAAMVAEMPAGAVPRQGVGPSDAQLQGAWAEATFARYSEEAAVPFARTVLERWSSAAPVAAQPEPSGNAERERAAFEAWLGITPCGSAHDLAWEAWKARAALAAQPSREAPKGAVDAAPQGQGAQA